VIGFSSAALAATLAGWVMVWQLWRGSRAMGEAAATDARFRRRLPRVILASGLMGAVLWGANLALGPMFGRGGADTWALAILVVLGIVAYFGIGHLIGAFRLSEFRRALKR